MIENVILYLLTPAYVLFSLTSMTFLTLISARISAEEAYSKLSKELSNKSFNEKNNETTSNTVDIEKKNDFNSNNKSIISIILGVSNTTVKYFTIFYIINTFVYYFLLDLRGYVIIILNLVVLVISNFLGTRLRIIGITGRSASGKSYMSKYIREKFKYTVLDIDQINREVLSQKNVIKEIRQVFGDSVFDEKGELNKLEVRKVIYHDADKRKKLEKITHFRVFKLLMVKVLYHKFLKFEKYVFLENAILLKIPRLMKLCFPIISVICADNNQSLLRLIKRDSVDKENAEALLNNQLPVSEFIMKSDILVENNGTLEEFEKSIDGVVKKLMTSI
jgi:dephospho-CoA kinase